MNLSDLLKYEDARSGVYKGLAACHHQPDSQMGTNLKELERYLTALNSTAAAHVSLMHSEWLTLQEKNDLQVEFARLFVGPFSLPAPPYGSVYLDGHRQVMDLSTIDVQRRYAQAGMELSENFKEVPDHIAAELEFMHVLICRVMEAIDRNDREGGVQNILLQKSFLDNHLNAWVPAFAKRVSENTEAAFYLHLAAATRQFLTEDMDALADFGDAEHTATAQHHA